MNLKSYAKINLYLDIRQKLNNGYHDIETIFQTINLFDEIRIEKLDDPGFRVNCNNPEVPVGKNSIVYQAIETMMQDKNIRNQSIGLAVSIKKNIPLASGLGGGSSNIATILLGISNLFHLEMTRSQLIDLATNFGMDIPFFITRGTVYAKGRGEILFPLISIDPPIHLLLVNPGIEVSTQWAYQSFDQEPGDRSNKKPLDIDPFLDKKKEFQLGNVSTVIYNRFDAIITKKYPVISHIKNKLKEMGALNASLSGSGPTVFGIFENEHQADEVYLKIRNLYPFVCKTRTIRASNIFLEEDS